MLEPDDIDALIVGFLKSEMDHGVAGGGAVPVELVGKDRDGVAGVKVLCGLPVKLDVSYASKDVQGLTNRMSVPSGAGSGFEGDADGAEA